jgi:hypothetical protein
MIGNFMCHGKPVKGKIQQTLVGGWVGVTVGVGGEIVVPRPSATASLRGRRQKPRFYDKKYAVFGWKFYLRSHF